MELDRIFIQMRLHSYILLCASAIFLLLSSCSTQRDGEIYQNLDQSEIQAGLVGNDDFELEIAYVGAIGHSFVYECYMKNYSDEAIVVDKSNFYMEHGDGQVIFPSEGSAIAEHLRREKKNLKKQKKSNTALGFFTVGLSTLASVSTGVPVGEALLFNAEPIFYIFDDKRWYNKGIESVEDEINYVQEAQFDQEILQPGQEIVRDLLFATTKIKTDVMLHYSHKDEPYSVTFPKKIYR